MSLYGVGIESERLEFERFELRGEPTAFRVFKFDDGEEVPLPPEHERFFDLAARGVTLQQIALHGWTSGTPFSFRALARFLAFLCEKRLIRNRSAYEFCEAARPGYAWRRSLVSEPFFELEVFRWEPGVPRPVLAGLLTAVAFAAGALGFGCLLSLFSDAYRARIAVGGAPVPFSGIGSHGALPLLLLQGLLWCSFARSCVGFAKFFLTRVASGEAKTLSLVVDLCSVRLESSEASFSQRKTGAEAFAALAPLAAALVPALFAFFGHAGPRASVSAALFLSLAFLIEASPFVRGPLTDALRYFYNWRLDRRPSSQDSGETEAITATLHVVANVGWIALAGAFFALPIVDAFRYARAWIHFSTLAGKISGAAFFGAFALAAVSFLDDVANAIAYGPRSDRLGVRRLWRVGRRRAADRAFLEALDLRSRAALESAPLIRQLAPDQKAQLMKRASLVSFARGQALCRQGERRRELYILLSGRASVEARKGGGRSRSMMTLEAGSVFGEVGFFLGHARTADVTALEPCVAIEIRRDASANELDPEKSAELRDRIRFLQALASSSFLRDLPGEAHDALAALGQPRSFRAGASIVREGERGDECFFIAQGTAYATQNGSVIKKMGPGDAFGEIALLRLQPARTASVFAETELLAMELKGARLWELMSANLLLAIEIERLALRRLAGDGAAHRAPFAEHRRSS